MIKRIISGGQTGADRAALDVSIEFNIPHGGWIPKGRRTEEGPLPEKYHLKEMPTGSYPERTERNVMDSDGTLIFSRGRPAGGTAYTIDMARKHGKPWIVIDPDKTTGPDAPSDALSWIEKYGIEVLNVAGPRASEDPGIYGHVRNILEKIFHIRALYRDRNNSGSL